MHPPISHPIVFFDGDCGLCDRTVRWLIASDPRGILRFCPLQSPQATHLLPDLPATNFTDPGTLILLDLDRRYFKSDAVLRIFELLGGWRARASTGVGWLPVSLRDRCYDWVAKNRHRWFPAGDRCFIEPGLKDRFIS